MTRINHISEEEKMGPLCRRVQFNTFRFLETGKSRNSQYYQRLVVFMIISSLAFGIVSTIEGYKKGWIVPTRVVLETLLLAIFLGEYVLRLWSSGAHGTYGAIGGWKKYVITPHMVIDMLVILSSLGMIAATQLNLSPYQARLVYLLQLLRVLRIDRQRGAFRAFWKVFRKHRKELLTCWYMGFLMVTFVSFLVYALEPRPANKDPTLDNLFNGVYWGVISLTTIGYGDISPETTTGKMLICCFAVFGTCFLAMPAGIIGSGFALQVAEQQKEKHVNRRRRPAAVLIQSFWRKYAADRDLDATWKPHIQGREDKYNNMKFKKNSNNDLLGMSITPMIQNISKLNTSNANFLETSELNPNGQSNSTALWFPRKTLTGAEKIALRFVRFLKCISSTKKFRQARRPYDERDILDQFASSQIEMFAKLRDVRTRIDTNCRCSDTKLKENQEQVEQMQDDIKQLEKEIKENNKLLRILIQNQNIQLDPVVNTETSGKKT